MRTTPTDIMGLARFILSHDCQSIAILTGAGVSVASGIPDFRSPGGIYDTLKPELITASDEQRHRMKIDPTNVVAWSMFRENQLPYLEVRRPFILGTRERKWKATIAHRFAELLHTNTKKLTRVYTQNIDGLDFQCKIPSDLIVPVHGTIGKVACEGCGELADYDRFCDDIKTMIKDIYNQDQEAPLESTPIPCEKCKQPLVKPTTVLFERNLPADFFLRAQEDLPKLDLLIVAGTSLVVSPANSLVAAVPKKTIRVVINLDPVGVELGIEYEDSPNKRDYFAQGECDGVFLALIKELGWLEHLKFVDFPSESARRVLKLQRNS